MTALESFLHVYVGLNYQPPLLYNATHETIQHAQLHRTTYQIQVMGYNVDIVI